MDRTAVASMIDDQPYEDLVEEHIGSPDIFLSTDSGKAWWGRILADFHHTSFSPGDWDRKTLSQLAAKVLEAKYQQACLDEIFEDHRYSPHEAYYVQYRRKVTSALAGLESDLSEKFRGVRIDKEMWQDRLDELAIEHLADDDDSSYEDMFQSHDLAEVIFSFAEPGEERMISCYGGMDKLSVCRALQRQLGALGYSIRDLRQIWDNVEIAGERLSSRRKRPAPLLEPAKVEELVANSSSHWFEFVLYAMIPIRDLIAFDPSKPFALSQYAIAAYNQFIGTFHDVTSSNPILLTRKDGHLRGARGHTPDQICCLVSTSYRTSLLQGTGS